MAKIKLTKGELKKQRDSLKQFKRYLPTLQLKKQQLQMKILEARKRFDECQKAFFEKEALIKKWCGLFGEAQDLDFRKWVSPKEIVTGTNNIAGAKVPVFKDIFFEEAVYDFYITPFWVDRAIEELKELIKFLAQGQVIKAEIRILERELRVTTQRVNLFEKVKIPECQENIRLIRICLGDQQANAVGISKVAKGKIVKAALEAVFV